MRVLKPGIKEKLLQDCNLHTIVRLPNSVFAPYTSIKTNLLFFIKGTPTKEVWFYEQKLPKDVVAYNKTKPMKIEDLNDLLAWWNKSGNNFELREENNNAWRVSLDEIKKHNFNLDFKNPYEEEKEIYDPKLLISEYNEIQKDITSLRDNLKKILSNSINSPNNKK